MSEASHDTIVQRLAQILVKLNRGEKLDPPSLAEEFGVTLRTIQRDLNERFAYLPLQRESGHYFLDPCFLGKLDMRDIERFASLAGVRQLFPSLSDDFLRDKQELEQGVAAQKQKLSGMLKELQQSLQKQGSESLVAFDVDAGKITLRDSVFDKGSACITPQAQNAIKSIESRIAAFLAEAGRRQVMVEGHTDSLPVSRPVTDFAKFCTVYDDNYTLSAARAREARKLMIGGINEESARKVIVAGYGDSHPLPSISPEDGRNRRVEVHFVVQDLSQK